MEGVQDTPDQDIKLPESEAALIPKTKLVRCCRTIPVVLLLIHSQLRA
jgi:hypothetical protein